MPAAMWGRLLTRLPMWHRAPRRVSNAPQVNNLPHMASVWLALILAAGAAPAQTVTIRVLATTDLHGNIYPYDYYAAKPAARGLAKIATLIARERAANPNTI